MQTKKSIKPTLYSIRDVYSEYAKRLINGNPKFVGKAKNGIVNYIIYKRTKGSREVYMTYIKFSNILATVHKKAGDRIIAGECYNLGKNLGFIQARCIERNYANKSMDYYATKLKKESILSRGGTLKSKENPDGEEYRVFRLDPNYVRIGWTNPHMVKNITLYEFIPANNRKDKTSLKNRFSLANKLNEKLRLKYPYYPYVTPKE